MKRIITILKSKIAFVPIGLFAITMFALAGFSHTGKVCSDVVINISNTLDNYFLDREDITNLLTDFENEPLKGTSFVDIDLKQLENKLKAEKYIQSSQVFKNLQGSLIVNVELRRPIARIIRPQAPDAYISFDRKVIPVSEKFSARKLLIGGDFADSLTHIQTINTPYGKQLFELLEFIEKDEFWRAQIAQIDIDGKGELLIYPQVTKQLVEFGTPDNYKKKFKKLKSFYRDVLPRKGWNHYEMVNLKFQNQIIAK